MFAKHQNKPASFLYAELKRNNIYVRYFVKPERIANFLRITIGNDYQNAALISALTKIIGN